MHELFKVENIGSSGVGLVSIKNIESKTVILTQKPLISVSTDGEIIFYCLDQEIKFSTQVINNCCCNLHHKFFKALKYLHSRASNYKSNVGPCMVIALFLILSMADLDTWSCTNYERISRDQGAVSLANIARNVLLNVGVDMSIHEILRVITSISENSFTIPNQNSNIVALYSLPITKVNHSCNPNCLVRYTGNTITLESSRDIRVGKELQISYIDIDQSREDRKKLLLQQYGFECKCIKCYGIKSEYYEASLRYNFCPNIECQNSSMESFNKFDKFSLNEDKVDCRLSFESNKTGKMYKTLAVKLGLLKLEKDNIKCWRCNKTWNKIELNEKEALLVEGIRKDILYETLKYIKNWIHKNNIIFNKWLNKLQNCTIN